MKVLSSLSLRGLKTNFVQCFIIFFVIESMIVNSLVLYFFWTAGSTVWNIVSAPGNTVIEKLSASPMFHELIRMGKAGGFVSVLQHTLERVYIEDMNNSKVIGKLGVDVSGAGEALYIYRQLQKWEKSKKWERLVVDIGANDGFMSSNSHNFIRWGWKAILVEPQASQLNLAKQNIPGWDWEKVKFLQAVIDNQDGFVNFKVSTDIVSMESHVAGYDTIVDDSIIKVRSYSVKSFANKFKIPRLFGILSIDAEASSSKVLYQWISQGFRPIFIIYESLHSGEPIETTIDHLAKAGYRYLIRKGWNHIFELTSLAEVKRRQGKQDL